MIFFYRLTALIYIYKYICIYICVCVCVCVRDPLCDNPAKVIFYDLLFSTKKIILHMVKNIL